MARLQGNTALYLKLLRTFKAGLEAQFVALKNAARQDATLVKPLAHKIRGAADNLSAIRIAAVASLLENDVAETHTNGEDNNSDMENQLTELSAAIEEFSQSVAMLSIEKEPGNKENVD